MNFISLPTFNVYAEKDSARATLIEFVNQLIARLPFVCDRIYSYMEQDYLPSNKTATRHIVTKRVDLLRCTSATTRTGAFATLSNGWVLSTHNNPLGYVGELSRIEEALGGVPILAALETNCPNAIEGYALKGIDIKQVRLLLQRPQ